MNNPDPTTDENIERYSTWKKNAPYLYEVIMDKELENTSFAVEWMPDITRDNDQNYSIHRLIVGTINDDPNLNKLIIMKATIPNFYQDFQEKDFDADRNEYGRYGYTQASIDTSIKINHYGNVNRARILPQVPNVIATRSDFGDVHLFDYTKHPSVPVPNSKPKPNLILRGHEGGGESLEWNIHKPGFLLTTSTDESVRLWDVDRSTTINQSDNSISSVSCYRAHNTEVDDVSWHKFSANLFASCAGDGNVNYWDIRLPSNVGQLYPFGERTGEPVSVLTIDFSPFNEHLLAMGDHLGQVSVWDIRNQMQPLFKHKDHESGIINVRWSPHMEHILVSSSNDSLALIWNLHNDTKSGAVFEHVGHNSYSVLDLSWNLNCRGLLATVANNFSLQLWKAKDHYYH